ncbi:MAG: DUF4139 domain-containing protein [Candidatus Omnitrophota bacterium]
MKKFVMLILFAFVLISSGSRAETIESGIDDQTGVEVTVYNSNIGLIKDTREIRLPEGVGELRFADVASGIQPVTVAVKSLNAPEQFMVLEQNYEYDLMNSQKLLDKYVGKKVKIIDENIYQGTSKELEAELLSNNNGQIYKIHDEIYLGYSGKIVLPEIPDNLIAKPTLTWMFQNESSEVQQLEVSYLTNNIGWKSDYVMTVSADDKSAGLNGWVTVDNRSGAEYRDAALKLVAGEVNRVQEPTLSGMEFGDDRSMVMSSKAGGFEEAAFFEYHIYDLQRQTTIKNNQTKQISLLEADKINIQKEFILYGQNHFFQSRFHEIPKSKVGVYLKFKNEAKNNLGMPLPAGTIRLYKMDNKEKLQFIGEDRIDHTPKDEEITLKIGEAFDIVAERVQMDFQNLGNRAIETAWKVVIRNHKEEDVNVTVIEPVSGEWTIIDPSQEYEKIDAQNIKFNIPVEKDGEATLTYRVRVSFR